MIGTDGGQASIVTSQVAAAVGGASFMQLLDSLQTITRMACLNINFPIWYIYFVEGFSMVMFSQSFGLPSDLRIQIAESSDDAPKDLDEDPNLRIYYMDTLEAYASVFVNTFLNVSLVFFIISIVFFLTFSATRVAIRLKLYWVYGRSGRRVPAAALESLILVKFWFFFRGLYFMLYYGAAYPLFVTACVQFSSAAGARPLWETWLAVGVIVMYVLLTVFWIIPTIRHPPTGPLQEVAEKWGMGIYEYAVSLWYVYPAFLFVFLVDAVMVVGGAVYDLSPEIQLCVVLTTSVGRALFFAIVRPCRDVRSNILHNINFTSDVLQVLLLYSMIGHRRVNEWNMSCTYIIAMCQFIVIILNMVVSVYEMILALSSFILAIIRFIRNIGQDTNDRWVSVHPTSSKAGLHGGSGAAPPLDDAALILARAFQNNVMRASQKEIAASFSSVRFYTAERAGLLLPPVMNQRRLPLATRVPPVSHGAPSNILAQEWFRRPLHEIGRSMPRTGSTAPTSRPDNDVTTSHSQASSSGLAEDRSVISGTVDTELDANETRASSSHFATNSTSS
jgi:hypothetical protein